MFNQPPAMPPVVPAGTTPTPPPAPTGAAGPIPKNSPLKLIIIIVLALLLVGAAALAIYYYNEYKVASTDVDSQVMTAVTIREKEITDELEAKFAEREKLPYKTFAGPTDYGSLNFKYPKTWSAYIAKDASKGGNFEAYLHPGEVPAVSNTTINALRVTIETASFETVTSRYKNFLEKSLATSSVITVGGTDATRYDGQLLNNIVGSIVIFKIRDKTVTFQTDAEIYRDDFNQILSTITFNE